MSRRSFVLALVVCSSALTLAQGRADAQAEPFKIWGEGEGAGRPSAPRRARAAALVGRRGLAPREVQR